MTRNVDRLVELPTLGARHRRALGTSRSADLPQRCQPAPGPRCFTCTTPTTVSAQSLPPSATLPARNSGSLIARRQ